MECGLWSKNLKDLNSEFRTPHSEFEMMRFDQFLYQKKKPFWEKALLFPLFLLSLPYGGVVRLRAFLYSAGVLETKRVPSPVISIGNMTVGGTGKTPLVMTLARGLMRRG